MTLPESLTTERLTLGPWRARDLDAYAAMVAERDTRAAAAPRDGRPTRDQLRATIERQRAARATSGLCLYVIRVEGEFAGYCGLLVGKATRAEPEIGYELLRRFHGRGYATEAATAVVSAAAAIGLGRLWATVRDWNTASLRVLAKVGFVASGRETVDDFGVSLWWTRDLTSQ